MSNSKIEHATSDTGASCPDTPKSDTTVVQHDNLSDYHVHTTPVLDESTIHLMLTIHANNTFLQPVLTIAKPQSLQLSLDLLTQPL